MTALPSKTIKQKVQMKMEKFEGLLKKPMMKLEFKAPRVIFAFLDGTNDSKQLIKLLTIYIKELCCENLPKIVLIITSPTYKENQVLRELIKTKSEKVITEAKEEMLSVFPTLKEGLIDTKFIGTTLKELVKLQEEYKPDIAFISSPFVDNYEILEAVSRHAYFQWIEYTSVPTLIVPKQNEEVIMRMFNSITLLLNDWRSINEKLNHSLFFLTKPKSKIQILSVIDRRVISELQDLTDLKIQQSLVELQKRKFEIFIPQFRQIISESEALNKIEINHSVKEGDSLEAIRKEIKNNNSGLIIIGQHTRYSYTGKLSSYILRSVKAVPILLIKSREATFPDVEGMIGSNSNKY